MKLAKKKIKEIENAINGAFSLFIARHSEFDTPPDSWLDYEKEKFDMLNEFSNVMRIEIMKVFDGKTNNE